MLLFRRNIFSDVEVASCVLRRLLCTQLSGVEDESFEGLRRGREGEVQLLLQGSGSQPGGLG